MLSACLSAAKDWWIYGLWFDGEVQSDKVCGVYAVYTVADKQSMRYYIDHLFDSLRASDIPMFSSDATLQKAGRWNL